MPQSQNRPPTTRLAPSPTGALHLGNARTFLVNWAMARRKGWRIVLRIEDLDGPRVKSGADLQAMDDLRWLGLNWDAGPHYQRQDLSPYAAALEKLRAAGLIYGCRCSRRDIEQAQSAPHTEDHELRYPGTCRHSAEKPTGEAPSPAGDAEAQRLIVPERIIRFTDQIAGEQAVDVQGQVGDFIVATKAGLPAYQLAVVVDDHRQGVTDVVRGDDLLASTARQLLLYEMLGLGTPPRYWHLPLVLGADGHRLAKRHGDTRIAQYRQRGVSPQRVIGLLAGWCGLGDGRQAMTAQAFAQAFEMERLPRGPVTFQEADERWLSQS